MPLPSPRAVQIQLTYQPFGRPPSNSPAAARHRPRTADRLAQFSRKADVTAWSRHAGRSIRSGGDNEAHHVGGQVRNQRRAANGPGSLARMPNCWSRPRLHAGVARPVVTAHAPSRHAHSGNANSPARLDGPVPPCTVGANGLRGRPGKGYLCLVKTTLTRQQTAPVMTGKSSSACRGARSCGAPPVPGPRESPRPPSPARRCPPSPPPPGRP